MQAIPANYLIFNAKYQGARAEYEIRTLERLAGELPKRAKALVLEWAAQHKEELLSNWEKAIVPAKMDKIEPLE